MTRYRFRGIFLLFLMGHATACVSRSWQAIDVGVSPWVDYIESQQPDQVLITTVSGGNSLARYIEAARPDQVRITTEDRTQYLLYSPSVESDEIVSSDGLSVPIADIVNLEIMDETDGWSPFAIAGGRAQWVLSFPFVEGDEIVDGDGDLSVPIPEIIQIEEMAINPVKTVAKSAGAAILGYTLVVVAVLVDWIAGY